MTSESRFQYRLLFIVKDRLSARPLRLEKLVPRGALLDIGICPSGLYLRSDVTL